MKVYFVFGSSENHSFICKTSIKYVLKSFIYIKKNEELDLKWINGDFYNGIIIDSGIFTFMYGGEKDNFSRELFDGYRIEYKEFVKKIKNPKAWFVELDAQKLIGASDTWEIRKEFASMGRRMICVYHLEDENPDKLIDFSDYIAVGYPELRKNLSKTEMRKLICYIASRAKRKGKKVHLLGSTSDWDLKTFSFCDSADSSSWVMINKVGYRKLRRFANKEIVKQVTDKIALKIYKEPGKEWEKHYSLYAEMHKAHYASIAGDQS